MAPHGEDVQDVSVILGSVTASNDMRIVRRRRARSRQREIGVVGGPWGCLVNRV